MHYTEPILIKEIITLGLAGNRYEAVVNTGRRKERDSCLGGKHRYWPNEHFKIASNKY